MLALALLFVVIISLLWLVVRLLQNFFNAYSNLHTPEHRQADELQSRFSSQQKVAETIGNEAEINTIINERLTEMEQKFPTTHREEDNLEEAEVLTKTLKQVLTSCMNLLKVRSQDSGL